MSESTSNLRRKLFVAAGIGAAVIGAGVSLGRRPAGPASLSSAAASFWNARFDRPEGGELPAASFKGKPLLLNFWATWCPPCVKELPELAQFEREFKGQGWQVLGLAIDSPSAVREFLKKLPLDFPLGLAGLTGTELTRTLGNTQGGLPFSVAFDVSGELIWRKLGATNLAELRQMTGKLVAG
ncbi:TlpA family protein disulfide reductase [Roseateles oligotrophus]|uniref:TlpA family protein disulfide reductase n=1 Tax=Roseateles oligotrophus TaxID=1769250 RepID=A0ABT2YJ00_9BURK|nr:TlpA disulfide reductase family protein [Roseateles oligotrophus]MCV2370046.1 TlpA family protein disulfide reductase [Roseateles oligotrophus]